MQPFLKLSRAIDAMNTLIGKLTMWLVLAVYAVESRFVPLTGVRRTLALLGGAVVVETVFAWPGLGLLAYESLFARDLNLLLGIFFVCTCLVVVVNLVVDVAYSLLDPRIELR